MQSLCLMLCRFSLAAWVGAAGLFVLTSVREQTSTELDAAVKDQLALLRFPDYYLFGFALVGTALVTGLLARNHPAVSRRAIRVGMAVTAAVLAIMLADYLLVYRPLAELITPPGSARTPQFASYHTASEYINEVHVSLALLAALILSWPGQQRRILEEP